MVENKSHRITTVHSILVLSRNIDALRAARALLASEGYRVITASTMAEAEQLWRQTHPRLVIIDADSPGLTEKILEALEVFFRTKDGGINDEGSNDCSRRNDRNLCS
jgi:CheY-like chemotaxis protein